jgi:hypothetical protein
VEVDVSALEDPEGRKADLIDGAIDEASMSHATFGNYAQGVEAVDAALPEGWQNRLVRFETAGTRGVVAWRLEHCVTRPPHAELAGCSCIKDLIREASEGPAYRPENEIQPTRRIDTPSTSRLERSRTQTDAAEIVGSSQSRIVKTEAGYPSVSRDLLVSTLPSLGTGTEAVTGLPVGASQPRVAVECQMRCAPLTLSAEQS